MGIYAAGCRISRNSDQRSVALGTAEAAPGFITRRPLIARYLLNLHQLCTVTFTTKRRVTKVRPTQIGGVSVALARGLINSELISPFANGRWVANFFCLLRKESATYTGNPPRPDVERKTIYAASGGPKLVRRRVRRLSHPAGSGRPSLLATGAYLCRCGTPSVTKFLKGLPLHELITNR